MNAAETFLYTLGKVSMHAGGLALVVLAAQSILRSRLSPRWRCSLWWLVALRLIVPVSPSSSLSIFNVIRKESRTVSLPVPSGVPSHQNPSPQVTAAFPTEQTAPPIQEPSPPNFGEQQPYPSQSVLLQRSLSPAPALKTKDFPPRLDWPLILLGSWLLGVFLLAAQIIRTSFRMHRRMKGLEAVSDVKVINRLRFCSEQMGVNKKLPIFETSEVTSPALYGFVQLRLLVPKGFLANYSDQEQEFVFLHELAHVKRRDLPLNWLLAMLQILHWFNPVLWLAAFRFRMDRELACDALALDRAGEDQSEAYGKTILRLLQDFTRPRAVPVMIGILEDKSQLRIRIATIAEFTPLKRGAWLAILFLVAVSATGLTDANNPKTKTSGIPISLETIFSKEENELFWRNTPWESVPKGTQDFGGIEFHLDGLLQLASKSSIEDGRHFRPVFVLPLKVINSAARTKFNTLHLIAGSGYDDQPGTTIANVIWQYTDGSSRISPIQYAVHIRNWKRSHYEDPEQLPSPMTKVAWTGSHPVTDSIGKRLRLYRLSIENPEPERPLQSLEFQSAMKDGNLLIAAMTLDPLKPLQRTDRTQTSEDNDLPLKAILEIKVVNSEEHPVSGAVLEVHILKDFGKLTQDDYTKTYTSDAKGKATLLGLENGLEKLEVRVSADGYGSFLSIWDLRRGDVLPSQYNIKLPEGIEVGGRVVGPEAVPVSEATVRLSRLWIGTGPIRNGEEIDFPKQVTTTDKQGHWKVRNLAKELSLGILVEVSHPNFLGTNFNLNGGRPLAGFEDNHPEILKQFREGTHQAVLTRAAILQGKVFNSENKPIFGAAVSYDPNRMFVPKKSAISGLHGEFVLTGMPTGKVEIVTASIDGAISRIENLSEGTNEIILQIKSSTRLDPGKAIGGIVQNENAEGLAGAQLQVVNPGWTRYWGKARTDGDGRFIWENPPIFDNRFLPPRYSVQVSGYERKELEMNPAGTNAVIILRRSRKLIAHIFHAGTHIPVTHFQAGVGWREKSEETGNLSAIILFQEPGIFTTVHTNGEFKTTLSEERTSLLKVMAKGYNERVIPLTDAVDGVIRMVIELTPSPTENASKPKPSAMPISLGSLFTKEENELFWKNTPWESVPKGTQDFGGIEFHLDGLLQLASKSSIEDGRNFRRKIEVPVVITNGMGSSPRISTLHLICATSSDDETGMTVATVAWKYADGSSRVSTIDYGIQLRNWKRTRYEEPDRLPSVSTKLAWSGSNASTDALKKRLRLYRLSIENPEPAKELKSLAFESAMNNASLFIAAITLDSLKPSERRDSDPLQEDKDEPLKHLLQARVVDSNGHPVAGAMLNGRVIQDSRKPSQLVFRRSYFTDSNGVAGIMGPQQGMERLEVVASGDGSGALLMIWDIQTGDRLPPLHTFKLPKASEIGGIVVDSKGSPVIGATVTLSRFWFSGEMPFRGEATSYFGPSHITDEEGRWTDFRVPRAIFSRMKVEVRHPDFVVTNFNLDGAVGMNIPPEKRKEDPAVVKQLLESTHRSILSPAIVFKGKILDGESKSIAGVTVSGYSSSLSPMSPLKTVITGADGDFKLENVPLGTLRVSVKSKEKNLGTKAIAVTESANEHILKFDPPGASERPHPVSGRVLNEKGEALPGVKVAVDNYRNSDYRGITDNNGEFIWEFSPVIPAHNAAPKYTFEAAGYETKRDFEIFNGTANIITLHKQRKLEVRVIIDGTEKPITQFRAGVGFTGPIVEIAGIQSRNPRFFFESGNATQVSHPNGEFTTTVTEELTSRIKIMAQSYEDRELPLAGAVDGVIRMVIELKPSATAK